MPLSDEQICTWLRERAEIAHSIAHRKPAADRDAWMMDASFYNFAAAAIEHYKDSYARVLNENAELLRRAAARTSTGSR
jgi:hypothetical protein